MEYTHFGGGRFMVDSNKENFESYLEQHTDHLGSVIHELWSSKDTALWKEDPYFYTRLGSLADKLGQVMFAHDILEEGLQYFPGNLRLVQLFSLSLIKCGFLLQARDLLVGLMKRGHQDEETLGILGRVYKEMWLLADKSSTSHPFLTRSRNLYLKAFLANRGYYSGINAASLSLLSEDRESADKLARHVLKICSEVIHSGGGDDYWVLATVGEACVVLDRRDHALAYYKRARKLAGKSFADLSSMRRQLNLLSRVSSIAGEILDDLRVPPVVAFTGHRIDSPGRKTPRFPKEFADDVARAIARALGDMDGQIGYASAASGSDVLFLEAMQERGAETNVVLPFDKDDFLVASVDGDGAEWHQRAVRAIERSSHVEEATRGRYEGADVLFSYANQIIMGKALLRSRFLETDAVLLAVWDGNQTKDMGGTGEFVQMWTKRGLPIKVIDPRTVSDAAVLSGATTRQKRPSKKKSRRSRVKRETVALLFADLVGFSRLSEDQVPAFIDGFLGTVARRLSRSSFRPIIRNIWGDALYFVFEDFSSAAGCALELRDTMRETDWAKLGLPAHLTMRIGLHAGPVFRSEEPITNRENFFGYHVNQAARIEPITSPGNVYASEHFAGLLLSAGADDLDCRYVGDIMLPKGFGSYPIYHVKRRNEIE